VLDLGEAPWPLVNALPVVDLDGDGALELIVWGEGPDAAPHRGFRAAYRVDLGPQIALTRGSVERRTDIADCVR
jgi:hypothetical protein